MSLVVKAKVYACMRDEFDTDVVANAFVALGASQLLIDAHPSAKLLVLVSI